MIRAIPACFVAATLLVSPAHALSDEELAIARTFEGAWGVASQPVKDFEQPPDMGCGEPRAITIRIEQDDSEQWRLYFHPEQFTGEIIVGASDEGAVQRLTIESFAPIGTHTNTYERRGDRLTMRIGWRNLELKRC